MQPYSFYIHFQVKYNLLKDRMPRSLQISFNISLSSITNSCCAFTHLQDLSGGWAHGAYPRRHIGYARDSQHLQRSVRGDNFRHRGHSHRISANGSQHSFGRRLVAGAGNAAVTPVLYRYQAVCALGCCLHKPFIIGIRHAGNLSPFHQVFPISGLYPIRFMWSVITIRSPGLNSC